MFNSFKHYNYKKIIPLSNPASPYNNISKDNSPSVSKSLFFIKFYIKKSPDSKELLSSYNLTFIKSKV